MYRQSPGRNQRSKGIKVKHVLQISLLLAICFWLIYQVKHSHEKKREFDESDARSLLQRESSDDFVKLGRKGIGVHLEGTLSKNVKHDELEEEEEAAGEVGETKSEEDELEGMKAEGKMDGAVGGEDDEIDEDEHGKLDEVDKEEDVVDGEEREDAVEDETREIETEDAHGRSEKEISVEESDHDGDDEIDEARAEHYKADDASSAVTHNTHVAATENEDEWLENSKERPEKVLEEEIKENNSEETNEGEKRKGLDVGAGEMTGDDHQSNTTTRLTKEGVLDKSPSVSPLNNTVTKGFNSFHLMSNNTPEVMTKEGVLDKSPSVSPLNNTVTKGFNSSHLMSNNTPEVMTENHDLMTQNVTENEPEIDKNSAIPTAEASRFQINALGLVNNNSIVNVDNSRVGSNSTDSGEPREAELHSEHFSSPSDNSTELPASENWADEGSKSNNNESSAIQNDKIKDGNTDTNNGTDAVLDSTVTQNNVDDQHNPFASRVENGIHKDLDNPPELPSNGTNTKDVVGAVE